MRYKLFTWDYKETPDFNDIIITAKAMSKPVAYEVETMGDDNVLIIIDNQDNTATKETAKNIYTQYEDGKITAEGDYVQSEKPIYKHREKRTCQNCGNEIVYSKHTESWDHFDDEPMTSSYQLCSYPKPIN